MKISAIEQLAFPEIRVIRFARFLDHRGYFTEHYRKSDFLSPPLISFLKGVEFRQMNQSFSYSRTVRGLHFQWKPYLGKLVRTIHGHIIDLMLDIRKGSATFGKIIAYEMRSDPESDFDEWIWIPPGFAHGIAFLQDTLIEYLCSGEYNPGCEAGISPLAADIDWSLCDRRLKDIFLQIAFTTSLISDKDKNACSVMDWKRDERSNNFFHDAVSGSIELSC